MLLSTLLAAATLASAAPTANSGTISLPLRTRASNELTHSRRALSKRANNEKYVPSRSRADGRVGFAHAAYVVPVEIGTPPQKFNLNFDTLETDLAVRAPGGNGTAFDASKSSTYSAAEQAAAMVGMTNPLTGTGLTGRWGQDKVAIGAASVPAGHVVTLNATALEQLNGAGDGLIGFGRTQADGKSAQPWWVGATRALGAQEFGLYLQSIDPAVTTAHAGELTLGGVNAKHVSGEIKYYPVVDSNNPAIANLWTIGEVRPAVKDKEASRGTTGVLASSLGYVIGPKADVDAFHKALGVPTKQLSNGDWVFQQQVENDVLGAAIKVGAETYPIDDYYMCTTPEMADELVELGWDEMKGETGAWCWSAVQNTNFLNEESGEAADADVSFWALGAPFMKSVYSAFRAEPAAVGFGKLASEGGWFSPASENQTAAQNQTAAKEDPNSGATAAQIFHPAVLALAAGAAYALF